MLYPVKQYRRSKFNDTTGRYTGFQGLPPAPTQPPGYSPWINRPPRPWSAPAPAPAPRPAASPEVGSIRLAARIAARLAARGVPYLGWALTAVDAYQLARGLIRLDQPEEIIWSHGQSFPPDLSLGPPAGWTTTLICHDGNGPEFRTTRGGVMASCRGFVTGGWVNNRPYIHNVHNSIGIWRQGKPGGSNFDQWERWGRIDMFDNTPDPTVPPPLPVGKIVLTPPGHGHVDAYTPHSLRVPPWVPQVAPDLVPPGLPRPEPTPPPVWFIPLRPDAPVWPQQREAGPQPLPQTQRGRPPRLRTGAVTWTAPLPPRRPPRGRPSYRPPTVTRGSVTKPPIIRVHNPVRSPPPRNTKEKKFINKTGRFLYGLYDAMTEAMDVIDILYDGLPSNIRKFGYVHPREKVETIWTNWDRLDGNKVATGLLMNALEDHVVGRAQAAVSRAMRNAGFNGYGFADDLTLRAVYDYIEGPGGPQVSRGD